MNRAESVAGPAEGIEHPEERRTAVFRLEQHEVGRARRDHARRIVASRIEGGSKRAFPLAHHLARGVEHNAFARAFGDQEPVCRKAGNGCGLREARIGNCADDVQVAVEHDEPAARRVRGPREPADPGRGGAPEKQQRESFVRRGPACQPRAAQHHGDSDE